MNDPAAGTGKALNLASRTEGGCRVLSVAGQLTEKECSEFLEALEEELGSGAPRVILNLAGLSYMSSAGLGSLVSVRQRFAEAGSRLILAAAKPRVRKLLALTSLDKLIETAESVEEALARP